jgi:hypothetical protein
MSDVRANVDPVRPLIEGSRAGSPWHTSRGMRVTSHAWGAFMAPVQSKSF